jgi:hypothetical protein
VRTELRSRADRDKIASWRGDQLRRSGFSGLLAARVASDDAYDLHQLIELVERGCAPELAVRIVAPLEREAAA